MTNQRNLRSTYSRGKQNGGAFLSDNNNMESNPNNSDNISNTGEHTQVSHPHATVNMSTPTLAAVAGISLSNAKLMPHIASLPIDKMDNQQNQI